MVLNRCPFDRQRVVQQCAGPPSSEEALHYKVNRDVVVHPGIWFVLFSESRQVIFSSSFILTDRTFFMWDSEISLTLFNHVFGIVL